MDRPLIRAPLIRQTLSNTTHPVWCAGLTGMWMFSLHQQEGYQCWQVKCLTATEIVGIITHMLKNNTTGKGHSEDKCRSVKQGNQILDTYMYPAYIFRNDLRNISVISVRCILHVSVIIHYLLNEAYVLVDCSVNQWPLITETCEIQWIEITVLSVSLFTEFMKYVHVSSLK